MTGAATAGRARPATGNEMDTYAADVAALAEALDLRDAVHVGHSTGGGEVARYVARHGKGRVAKAVLISAVPPIMVKTRRRTRAACRSKSSTSSARALAVNRAQFYLDLTPAVLRLQPAGRAGSSRASSRNWWRQGMMGGIKAQYDCIKAFSETDFTEDLKAIDVPTLVMHGEDDQIVPFADSAPLSAKLLQARRRSRSIPGLPHGMPTTHAEQINADLLAFIRS